MEAAPVVKGFEVIEQSELNVGLITPGVAVEQFGL
jgi:hypothetical protein